MTKEEFLNALQNALSGLPQEDVNECLSFYGEMIDDRMEEGQTEEEAVASVGSIDDIVSQTVADIPFSKLAKEKIKPQRSFYAWEIVLIILGFPLWFPLLAAACAVVLSVYVTVWSLIISLWAIEVALWALVLGGAITAVVHLVKGNFLTAAASLGVALFAAGASIFMFFGCKKATAGILKLTKKAIVALKCKLFRKERSK